MALRRSAAIAERWASAAGPHLRPDHTRALASAVPRAYPSAGPGHERVTVTAKRCPSVGPNLGHPRHSRSQLGTSKAQPVPTWDIQGTAGPNLGLPRYSRSQPGTPGHSRLMALRQVLCLRRSAAIAERWASAAGPHVGPDHTRALASAVPRAYPSAGPHAGPGHCPLAGHNFGLPRHSRSQPGAPRHSRLMALRQALSLRRSV
jgi:hypothetical protein